MRNRLVNRRREERGSALLIVFVFAAMVAIMLYMEMPVAMFEAQREKEQVLIDRGNEYAHAVKLYVRKIGAYPPNMEALESTNRMRFLRHRFKDPFTGKEDWRILHAGPGGQLIDSKINPVGSGGLTGLTNAPGSTGSFGNTSTGNTTANANSANSGFGNSGFSSGFGNNSSDSSSDVVVPAIRQRAPAVSSGSTADAPSGGSVPTDPNALPPLPGLSTSGNPSGTPGQTGMDASANANGTAAAQTGGTAGMPNSIRNLTSTPNALAGTGAPATGSMGVISSGGIAGVASKAKGHSIKLVNDQDDYSLWEFWYDPTKDPMRGGGQVIGIQPATNSNAAANNNSSSTTSFTIGSSSSGTTTTNPTPPTPQPASQQNPQQ